MASPRSGKAAFTVDEEIFYTSYRIWGDPNRRRPLVVIHGGPGMPSNYLEDFSTLASSHGIPVILYDQLGCGTSMLPRGGNGEKHPHEEDASSWNESLFMGELENLLIHLGIHSDFDLLGHSWGGMLGASYAAKRRPAGLKNLVIANAPARIQDWCSASLKHLATDRISEKSRSIIRNAESHPGLEVEDADRISLDPEEYQNALGEFLHTFALQVDPWPESFNTALREAGKSVVSGFTYGPAWCVCQGTLHDWDVTPYLANINARTLVYNGKDDQAQDFVVRPFCELIPNAKWVRFENSSHCPHYEEPQKCMELVADFLLGAV